MRSLATSWLLVASSSLPSSVNANIIRISSQQCWRYEASPFAFVTLQSSVDGATMLIEKPIATVVTSTTIAASELTEERSEYHPWSYAPVCTQVLQVIGDKLCIYTNTSFSQGRGISIFTTPSIAESFVRLPPFQDPEALPKANINTNSGTWYTSTLPNKGVGILATKSLKFKDRVTAYTPAFLAYLESELGTAERESFFRVAVDQLPEKTRGMFLGLATVYGYEQVRYQDIVKANTFQMGVGREGVNHMAIFPETARLNHACAPNAQYYLDPDLLTHVVQITRPVAKDEEITISYTSPLDPTAIRHDHLSESFHFTCTCPRCSSPSSTDITLQTIQLFQASLNDWSSSSTGSPSIAEKLLTLYRDEGLEGFMDIPYGFAALAYNAVGDAEKAREYAEKAGELILMKDGPWTANLKIWKELLRDVEGHWSFKRRV